MRLFILSIFVFFLFSCQNETPQSVENQEGLIALNGTELFVKVVGQGEPIVVIHGGPGLDHTYFLPQMGNFAQDHTLIFYDQRLGGKSATDLDSTQISLDAFLGDIEAIRKHFGLGKMNLLGHSWGGLLAMFYALEYPNSLNKLILSGASPASSALRASEGAKIAMRFTAQDSIDRAEILSSEDFQNGKADAYENFFRLMYKKEFVNEIKAGQLTLDFPENFVQNSRKLGYLGKDVAQYDLHEDLKKVETPTLVIYGDFESGAEAGAKIHENLPNSEFVLLEECGHFPFVEKPRPYFKAIKEFLSEAD